MSRTKARGPHGIVLVDKPRGPSSAEVVDWARWALGQSVGHFGTLDPGADGLLVLGIGWATRLNPFLSAVDKSYRATFALGASTDTDDAQGQVTAEGRWDAGTLARAEEALLRMIGTWRLPPPVYSAVKVEGQRAHALAREGQSPQLADRPMSVFSCEEVDVDGRGGTIEATVRVSKGTYVRSLAVELGRRVGCPTHLQALRRVACGTQRVDDETVVRGFTVTRLEDGPSGKPRHRLRAMQAASPTRDDQRALLLTRMRSPSAVLPFPRCAVRNGLEGTQLLERLGHGRAVSLEDPGWQDPPPIGGEGEGWVGVVAPERSGLIVARRREDGLQPHRTILSFQLGEECAPSRSPASEATPHLDNPSTG